MKHNWEYKKLGEVCDFVGGGTPSKSNEEYYTGDIPWATVRDMVNFELSSTELCITEQAVKESATNILPEGMIVISTHVGLGKICITKQKTAINQDLKGILFKTKDIDKYFFVHWYRSIADHIITNGHGATVKGVTLSFMKGLEIPVPRMAMQERIVAELDEINAIIDAKRKQLKQLDLLAQSIFYTMFGDPVTNPKGWQTLKIGDIAKTMSGGTPKSTTPEYYGGEILWLRSGDVKGFIYDTEIKITQLGVENSSAKIVPSNSVAVAMYGATAGQVGIIKAAMTTNQAVCSILPNESTLPIYLMYVLTHLNEHILKSAHGAAQPNISQGIIKATKIILPPLELQQQFAVKVEAIEAQKADIEASIKELQTLLDSRMDYWFN